MKKLILLFAAAGLSLSSVSYAQTITSDMQFKVPAGTNHPYELAITSSPERVTCVSSSVLTKAIRFDVKVIHGDNAGQFKIMGKQGTMDVTVYGDKAENLDGRVGSKDGFDVSSADHPYSASGSPIVALDITNHSDNPLSFTCYLRKYTA